MSSLKSSKIELKKCILVSFVCLCLGLAHGSAQVTYPGLTPGNATAKKQGSMVVLENSAISVTFNKVAGKIRLSALRDKQNHQQLALSLPIFEISLANGKILSSNDFTLTDLPVLSGGADSKTYTANLNNGKIGLTVRWQASLGRNDNFIRQVFTFDAKDSVRISKLTLIKLPAAIAVKKAGSVDGSPLVYRNLFFAVEHPMSQTSANKVYTTAYLPRLEALKSGEPLTVSSVFGVVPTGQLRRGFLYYVEKQRAHAYRQMLHYNSWFDLSWVDKKLNDSVCLDRIKVFTDSLIDKRKVKLDAFLFDDGWDDNKTLWQFNSGFPDGFSNLSKASNKAGAALGVWISPWGGYDEPKMQRLAFGKKQQPPFETNSNGFSLTGPVYYSRFSNVALNFIQRYNVSMFKFDGVGAGNGASGASLTYQKDIEAFLRLITQMRASKPDLYLSLTVGTWPSVYWLKYGDAIWRAGDDTGLAGDGSKRQQWITYKDAQTYKNVVKRAPLFPLNSIMYHGVCIADNGLPGKLETDDKNISDEVWSFFGNGTGLQELYVNPHKLNTAGWNTISAAAQWSRNNKAQLADIHWVGGDPAKGEIYGFAGWSKNKGVLTLRNPTGATKSISLSVREIFEIPQAFTDRYSFSNARAGSKKQIFRGNNITVRLMPYEVKVFNSSSL